MNGHDIPLFKFNVVFVYLEYLKCNFLYDYRPWKVLDWLFNFGNECIDRFLKRFIPDSLYIYIRITLGVSDTLEYLYSIYTSFKTYSYG